MARLTTPWSSGRHWAKSAWTWAAASGASGLPGMRSHVRTLVMEWLLDTLVANGANHAFIDITGVPTVDTEVAQHLLRTVNVARRLGIHCTVSGVRPQVAQKMVALGHRVR
jgi:rsbT co-antagonist protein RsbR